MKAVDRVKPGKRENGQKPQLGVHLTKGKGAGPQAFGNLDLSERIERAQHLFRLRNNLANGSADALNSARACLTFDPQQRCAHYIERFAASIDPGAKSGNTSRGGRQERQEVMQDIEQELKTLAIAYEEAFSTDAYR